MTIKTKKYALPKKTYIKQAYFYVLKQQWWVSLIYLAICGGYFWIDTHWWITGASIALVLYLLFWLIQFAGVTQLEQTKMLFEKINFEITSQQITMFLKPNQGMSIKWEQIKKVKLGKDYFILFISKVQFFYFPHKIFNSHNEIKLLETILKRKNLIK